jgi:hypothetical protein
MLLPDGSYSWGLERAIEDQSAHWRNKPQPQTFRVYFTNFDYCSQHEGKTLDEAREIAQKAGFQASILDPQGNVVASWCPIAGFKTH